MGVIRQVIFPASGRSSIGRFPAIFLFSLISRERRSRLLIKEKRKSPSGEESLALAKPSVKTNYKFIYSFKPAAGQSPIYWTFK